MKKRFLPLSMLLITIVLAQASFVANATGVGGKYTPRTASKATFSSFMKSIRANQETGLIDPADMIAAQKAAQGAKRSDLEWTYAGPDNYGGLTRAVVYKSDGTVVIGTMFGDIYQTTNGGITFRKIYDLNLPVSCMVNNGNDTIYIGTGDGRNAQNFNGLSTFGYDAGFIGKGVYRIAPDDTIPVLLESTDPARDPDWVYVNELAYTNGKLYAATAAGIMMSDDQGDTWSKLIQGNFRSVKSNNNGDILAADASNVFLSKGNDEFNNISDGIAANENPKIIAMSPTDANFMYIAYLTGSEGAYTTGDFYFTQDGGTTWQVGLAGTTLYPIFGSDADYDGFIIVYPNNPRKLLIGSDNLWVVEDANAQGVNSYRPVQISEYAIGEFSLPVALNRYGYLHQGIQTIAFNPNDFNEFFVGTNGGVYKGEYYASLYSYRSSNRYFLEEDQHTSVARMMNVGVGGVKGVVIGGCLDHGTIVMVGDENMNNTTTGELVFPHPTNNDYVSTYFDKSYAGGPCAISTINPDIFFLSTTGSLSTPIYRTQTAGVDFDQNFEGGDSPVITNENAFKTPFAFFETYNDTHTSTTVDEILETYNLPIDTLTVVDTLFINDTVYVTNGTICAIELDTLHFYNEYPIFDPAISEDTVLYEAGGESLFIYHIMHDYLYTDNINLDTLFLSIRHDAKAGDVLNYYSIQSNYPISYTLPEPPHDNEHVDPNGGWMWIPGDTIRGLHDPLRTILVCAVEDAVYMTKDALVFDKVTDWFKISDITGIPTAVTMSSDGTTAYVGTNRGGFYTFDHLNDVFAAEQADVTNTLNPCVNMTIDTTTFSGRAITNIAVNPTNMNDIIITLGNYGNNDYVYRTTNGGTSFTSIQGNLPKVPVYSSVIAKRTDNDPVLLIVGTEIGIYTSENGSTWTKSGDFSCPIMDIKQAIMDNHDAVIDVLYDDMGNASYVIYPGIDNQGMLYAATYGSGVLANGRYLKDSTPVVVEDDDDETTDAVQFNVFPNPLRNYGNMNITLAEGANVSYQIYDLSGRMVANSNLGYYGQGNHKVTFNTRDLSSGSYIIRLQAGSKSETAKFLVY